MPLMADLCKAQKALKTSKLEIFASLEHPSKQFLEVLVIWGNPGLQMLDILLTSLLVCEILGNLVSSLQSLDIMKILGQVGNHCKSMKSQQVLKSFQIFADLGNPCLSLEALEII